MYNSATNTWTPGPDLPNANDSADGPAAILPDGNILLPASPGVFNGSITFFIFDGITFTQAPATQSSPALQSWQTRMLILPTGQAMYLVADGRTKDVELYTTTGRVNKAGGPPSRAAPANLDARHHRADHGRQFNGSVSWR